MSEIKALEELREIAADINASEIVDHMELYPSCVFDGAWLDAWHNEFYRIIDRLEAEIDGRFMELPVDADGVPIHPGNRVELDGKGGEVWLVGTTDVMCNDGMSYRAVAVNHAKPDPLKELLSELANEVWEASCTCQTTWSDSGLDGIEERYADEIREMMGKGADQSNQRTCDACLGR